MSAESVSHYCAQFARLETELAGAELLWLHQQRAASLERFTQLGFPDSTQEDWKYTNVDRIARHPFRCMPESLDELAAYPIGEYLLPDSPHLLVYINGRFVSELSHVDGLPSGSTVSSITDCLKCRPEIRSVFEECADMGEENGFSALNGALWSDGAYVALEPGVALEQPIHLLFITTEADLATCPRNLIQMEEGARATIVEHYAGMEETVYFTNALTQIVAKENAQLQHLKLQQESAHAFHIACIRAQQDACSRIISHSFALGALLSRNDISIRMQAPSCEANLNGLYMASGRQHVDHHTRIDHLVPRGISRESYRGVLGGAARGVFNGKVIIHPGAQKSDAFQSNRNLLLSEHAEVDTKPQLEIYADDVKCAHGATVGRLDDEQIFYLRTRGLDESEAHNLLIYAFASESFASISSEALRNRLEELLIKRLPGGKLVRELS